MDEITEKIRDVIRDKFHIKKETGTYIEFKYNKYRGAPDFKYDKLNQNVVRVDKRDDTRNQAISVEVKTSIYALLKEGVSPVDAQQVFLNRQTEEMRLLVKQYGGIEN